jgi:hypothetical protein
MEKSWLSTGKIACVVYMLEKMKAGAKKSATSAHKRDGCSDVLEEAAEPGISDTNTFLSSVSLLYPPVPE